MSHYHKQLSSARWQAVRQSAFTRDGWRCVRCGRAGRLEADHIVPLDREPGQDPYDPDGLQTLCRSCHVAETASENSRPAPAGQAEWRALVAELVNRNP